MVNKIFWINNKYSFLKSPLINSAEHFSAALKYYCSEPNWLGWLAPDDDVTIVTLVSSPSLISPTTPGLEANSNYKPSFFLELVAPGRQQQLYTTTTTTSHPRQLFVSCEVTSQRVASGCSCLSYNFSVVAVCLSSPATRMVWSLCLHLLC